MDDAKPIGILNKTYSIHIIPLQSFFRVNGFMSTDDLPFFETIPKKLNCKFYLQFRFTKKKYASIL